MAAWFLSPLIAWAKALRFPKLLALTATLFLVNLAIPDFIPFIDEILLGLGTLLLARWKDESAQKDRLQPPNG